MGEDDGQSAKRAAAAAYDYEGDPRWSEYWGNILIPPHMSARSDVVLHYKRKFYHRFIVRRCISNIYQTLFFFIFLNFLFASCGIVFGFDSDACLRWMMWFQWGELGIYAGWFYFCSFIYVVLFGIGGKMRVFMLALRLRINVGR